MQHPPTGAIRWALGTLAWIGWLLVLFGVGPGLFFESRLDVRVETGMSREETRYSGSLGWSAEPLFDVTRSWGREQPIADRFPDHPIAPKGAGKPITESTRWDWHFRPIGRSAGALALGIVILGALRWFKSMAVRAADPSAPPAPSQSSS